MPFHPLTNFEIQHLYQNETKSSAVYSRKSLPKLRDGAYKYVINVGDYKLITTYWKAL